MFGRDTNWGLNPTLEKYKISPTVYRLPSRGTSNTKSIVSWNSYRFVHHLYVQGGRQDFTPRAVTVVRVTSSLSRAIIPGIRSLVESLASGIVSNRTPAADNEVSLSFDRDPTARLVLLLDFPTHFSFLYCAVSTLILFVLCSESVSLVKDMTQS